MTSSGESSGKCYHCHQANPEAPNITLTIDGEEQRFCCYGCQMVTQTIQSCGLSHFYQFRDMPNERPKLDSAAQQQLRQFDEPLYQKQFVKYSTDKAQSTAKATFIIEGISCAACVWLIESRLKQLPNVIAVNVNLSDHRLDLQWKSDAQLSDILRPLIEIGYDIHPYHADTADQLQKKAFQRHILRLSVAALGLMQVMMYAVGLYSGQFHGMDPQYLYFLRWVSALVTTPVVLFSAQPFFSNAWRGLSAKHLNMDVPISIAILGAYFASLWATFTHGEEVYFDSVSMFVFFLLLGRFLEMRARHNTNRTVRNLMRINPDYATLLIRENDIDTPHAVPVNKIQMGDRLLIKPGEHIPVDGMVIEGKSAVSEAMLTGEFATRPVSAEHRSQVLAGSQNSDSVLTVEVSATGDNTTLGSIIQLLHQAQQQKPKLAQLADRIAHYFVAAVLTLTLITYLIWQSVDPSRAFWVALAVLVATCPCALSLATPTVLTVAINKLAEHGIVITQLNALPFFAKAKHIVFDKTGTLTAGHFTVQQVDVLQAGQHYDELQVLKLCAYLEQYSEHPIATAFKGIERVTVDPITDKASQLPTYVPSQGIEATLNKKRYRLGKRTFAISASSTAQTDTFDASKKTYGDQDGDQSELTLYLSENDQLIATITLSDSLRHDAEALTEKLRHDAMTLHLLTGDQPRGAAAVAQALPALEKVASGCSPEQKQTYVKGLTSSGEAVIVVGDGINDSPILSCAHASIAMGSGTDLAKSCADAVLIRDHLSGVHTLRHISQQVERRIQQNISWAILYNISILPLAAMGWVPPYIAAAGMSLSSLLVVINASRIKAKAAV